MAKLTLSVNPAVVSRAHAYARLHGVSVSRMVETYLLAVTANRPGEARTTTPVLDSLTGILRENALGDYHRHLEEKYL